MQNFIEGGSMVAGWPNLASPADSVFYFILGIAVTFLFLNTAVMIYFVIRYSRKRETRTRKT